MLSDADAGGKHFVGNLNYLGIFIFPEHLFCRCPCCAEPLVTPAGGIL